VCIFLSKFSGRRRNIFMRGKRFIFFLGMFVILILSLASCSKSDDATAPAYSQSDLTGTWNFTGFQNYSSNSGWDRGTGTIDSSGSMTCTSFEDTHGGSMPAAGTVTMTINSSGTITMSGGDDESHCSMSTDKNTIVCVATNSSQPSMRIMVKTTGVTFSNSDLTGPLAFNMHGINSGGSSATDRYWEYAAGTINSSRQVTFTDWHNPEGAVTLPAANYATLSVGADGFVTNSADTNWRGMLSSDKKMMVYLIRDEGSPEIYGFGILAIGDETFTGTSDLAGDWKIDCLWGGNGFGWAWIDATINSSGVTSMTSKLDSAGNTTLGSSKTLAMTTSGIITESAETTLHGVLSHDWIISVVTGASGNYELDIMMRK
jgi:hypothetical protein